MTAFFLALIQFVTYDEKFGLSLFIMSKMFVMTGPGAPREGGTAIYIFLVENCPSPEADQKYTKLKNELEKISYDRTRGACVRSKARWHEFGERSSKYFFNLER